MSLSDDLSEFLHADGQWSAEGQVFTVSILLNSLNSWLREGWFIPGCSATARCSAW